MYQISKRRAHFLLIYQKLSSIQTLELNHKNRNLFKKNTENFIKLHSYGTNQRLYLFYLGYIVIELLLLYKEPTIWISLFILFWMIPTIIAIRFVYSLSFFCFGLIFCAGHYFQIRFKQVTENLSKCLKSNKRSKLIYLDISLCLIVSNI